MRSLSFAALGIILTASPIRAECGLEPGYHEQRLQHGGTERLLRVEVPPNCDPGIPLPLVLDFHGLGVSPEAQALRSRLSTLGAMEGFFVVHPEGVGLEWNAFGGLAGTSTADDVAFARALVDALALLLPIDRSRVYATGHSNGAAFTHRLACEAADLFAALVPVSYSLHGSLIDCVPARPVPVLQLHGLGDPIVPYTGFPVTSIGEILSAPASAAAWAGKATCAGDPLREALGARSFCDHWPDCDDGVAVGLCGIHGGHFIQDSNPEDIDLARLTWDFMSVHALPEPDADLARAIALLILLWLARRRFLCSALPRLHPDPNHPTKVLRPARLASGPSSATLRCEACVRASGVYGTASATRS